jgi:alpha-tubulin suppressor-like RCC1 family protein
VTTRSIPSGKTCPTSVKVAALAGATALTGGYVHSLAATGDGAARGWGRNAEGEVGDATTTVRTTLVTVTGLFGITAVTTATTSAAYTYDGHGTRTSRNIGARASTSPGTPTPACRWC